MTVTAEAVPPVRPQRSSRDRQWGRFLLALTAVAFVLPWPHQVLSGVGTTDNRTLDSAGYSQSLTWAAHAAWRPQKGDDLLGSVMRSQRVASDNKVAADRRLLCLAIGLPGAYLMGRSPRRKASDGQ